MRKVDEKVTEAFCKIEEGVKNVFESENYKNYLKFLSKFYNYSSNNCLLIMSQCPDASMVAGMNFWKSASRTVKKGEKAIQILAPIPHEFTKLNEETGEEEIIKYISFKTSYVFDVSQTEGQDIPRICKELKGTSEEIRELITRMEEIFKEQNIKLEFWDLKGEQKGFYRQNDDFICIKKGLDDLQTLKTMIHEYAHYSLHKGLGMEDRQRKELEAESVAYSILNYFGLDSSDYSFGYLASWSKKDVDLLKKVLSDIQKNTKSIINTITKEVA